MPCRWPTTGTPGATRARRLVERREVVQVQHVGVARARRLPAPAPRPSTWCSAIVVVERGEHAVRRALAVLVGRVERRVGEQRVGRVERGGHVDRADVEAAVERARVAGTPGQR